VKKYKNIARALLALLLPIAAIAQTITTTIPIINIRNGWNLYGNASNKDIDVTPTFGSKSTEIKSIWTWDSKTGKWNFYTPTNGVDSAAYATSMGYGALTKIPVGSGFWINASTATDFAMNLPYIATPIPVKSSSYANAKEMNLPPQTYPVLPMVKGPSGNIVGQSITGGIAFADFFQDGTMSMIGVSNIFDGSQSTAVGNVYFFRKNTKGEWIDSSSTLLSANDRTGCVSGRKIIVADFNGDGKPDAFIACHGNDWGQAIGEHPRFIFSQPDGTYKNIDAGFNCYCHGASAAELNNKGYADLVVTDTVTEKQPYLMINNKDGTFTKVLNKTPQKIAKFYQEGYGWLARQIYTTELIDVNGDGKFDWLAAGNEGTDTTFPTVEYYGNPKVFLNDGQNNFDNIAPINLPITGKGLALDVLLKNGTMYLLKTPDYQSTQIVSINISDLTQKTIYTHSGLYPSAPGVKWLGYGFPWIIEFNGYISSTDADYNLTIPLQ
jgi:hypothetical protein